MKEVKLSLQDYQIFLYKALIFLGLSGGSFLFTLIGFFYASLIVTILALSLALLAAFAKKKKLNLKPSKEFFIACAASAIIATAFSLYSVPTVFSGRDQGSISEAAIRLSQNHKLFFATPASEEFFQIYGKGRALNFPGFYYTQSGSLVTQFPLVYISWLATFFSIFGISGFAVANAILFYFFLTAFYLLIRLFLKTWSALPTILFTITSFSFMWLVKYTLSENMALPLLWIAILSLMLFLKNKQIFYYYLHLGFLILLCFTRIEGFAFLAASSLILFFSNDSRKILQKKYLPYIILPAGIFLFLLAANFIVDNNFYREIAKALLPAEKIAQPEIFNSIDEKLLPNFYNLKILFIYGFLGFFLFGAVSITVLFSKKQYHKLIPFLLILPSTIYLFDSHISSDHPWMLRRFMFSLLPAAIFYAGLLVGMWLEKKSTSKKSSMGLAAASVILVLIAGNLPAFAYFAPYRENKNLLEQTKQLSEKFSDKDLILIDQQTTKDGWAMLNGPMSALFRKNAVYFFNANDYNKLDLSKFQNIYLITPDEQIYNYSSGPLASKMTFFDDYTLNYFRLNINQSSTREKVRFPEKINLEVHGKIYKLTR